MQPWPDPVQHTAAHSPGIVGATLGVGKMALIAPVLMALVLFYWLVFCLSVAAWLKALIHLLGGNFIRCALWFNVGVHVVLVDRQAARLGHHDARNCLLHRPGSARNIRAMAQEAAGNADHTNDASVANAQDTGQRQSDYVIREG